MNLKKNNRNNMGFNFFYNTFSGLLSIFIPLVTTPYISRILGVEGIGAYGYTASVASYFVLLASVGINTYGQREIAYCLNDRHRQTKILYEIQIFKLFTVLLSLIFYIFVILVDKSFVKIYYAQGLAIIAVWFDISWFFQGLEDFKKIVITNFLSKIVGTILIFIFVKSENDLIFYILCQTVILVLGNMSMWIYLPKYITCIRMYELHPFQNFKQIMELFIPRIAIRIYSTIDKIMLGLITNNTLENGYYEQPQKIISIAQTIIDSLGCVLLPKISMIYMSGKNEEIEEIIEKVINVVFAIVWPMAIGIAVISRYFIPCFLGKGYEKSSKLLIILAPIIVITGFCNILGNGILIPTKQQNKATIATICGAIVNILLNLMLIQRWLSVGAAVASLCAETIVMLIHYFFVRKYLNIYQVFKSCFRYFIIGASMGLCVHLGTYSRDIIQNDILFNTVLIIIGILSYLGILIIIKDKVIFRYIFENFKIGKYK